MTLRIRGGGDRPPLQGCMRFEAGDGVKLHTVWVEELFRVEGDKARLGERRTVARRLLRAMRRRTPAARVYHLVVREAAEAAVSQYEALGFSEGPGWGLWCDPAPGQRYLEVGAGELDRRLAVMAESAGVTVRAVEQLEGVDLREVRAAYRRVHSHERGGDGVTWAERKAHMVDARDGRVWLVARGRVTDVGEAAVAQQLATASREGWGGATDEEVVAAIEVAERVEAEGRVGEEEVEVAPGAADGEWPVGWEALLDAVEESLCSGGDEAVAAVGAADRAREAEWLETDVEVMVGLGESDWEGAAGGEEERETVRLEREAAAEDAAREAARGDAAAEAEWEEAQEMERWDEVYQDEVEAAVEAAVCERVPPVRSDEVAVAGPAGVLRDGGTLPWGPPGLSGIGGLVPPADWEEEWEAEGMDAEEAAMADWWEGMGEGTDGAVSAEGVRVWVEARAAVCSAVTCGEGTSAQAYLDGEAPERRRKRMRMVSMNVNACLRMERRTDGGGGEYGEGLGEGGDLLAQATRGLNVVSTYMVDGGISLMVLVDTRLGKSGLSRLRAHMKGAGPYEVVGTPCVHGARGGKSAGVAVVYHTDDIFCARGTEEVVIPGRVMRVPIVVLADESAMDVAAVYMPCRGTREGGEAWAELSEWVYARKDLVLAGDMNASVARDDAKRTPSDVALRELVDEGILEVVSKVGCTYARAGTALDYWLATPDCAWRWESGEIRKGVSDHEAVEVQYLTQQWSGECGEAAACRLRLEKVSKEQWEAYGESVGGVVRKAVDAWDARQSPERTDDPEAECERWVQLVEVIQDATVTAISGIMKWEVRGARVERISARRRLMGRRKLEADIAWWESILRVCGSPREVQRKYGKRVRAFAQVEWEVEDGELSATLSGIARETIDKMRVVLGALGEIGRGDDLVGKVREATRVGGGNMMSEVCAVLRTGAVGGGTAYGALGAVYVNDDVARGEVAGGQACKDEVWHIMRQKNRRRYAYLDGVSAIMETLWGRVEEEGELSPSDVDAWVEAQMTDARMEASVGRAGASKGCGVDGYNDYLIARAPAAVQQQYFELLRQCARAMRFPERWKEWVASFAMKPGENPLELGRRRDLWCTCAGQKVVARVLAALYEDHSQHQLPVSQGGFSPLTSVGMSHWSMAMQRKQCKMQGRACLRGYCDLGGYFMSVVRKVQAMVERQERVAPPLTAVMQALQEGSCGRGKTAAGLTEEWEVCDGLGQGCAAAAIRSKYMTALIQRAVGRLCAGFQFTGGAEVGQLWFADDGACMAETMAGLQLFFDVVWVVTRLAGLDLIVKANGTKTAWSGVVLVNGVWRELRGWRIWLPDGKTEVPWVASYKHLGWWEGVPSGVGYANPGVEWEQDRAGLVKRLKRVLTMAARMPFLRAEQLRELVGLMLAGFIGHVGRCVPIDDATCGEIVAVMEYVARRRGFGVGTPHLSLFDVDGGLGWAHPGEFVAATLVAQVDEVVTAVDAAPAKVAFLSVLEEVAYKLGCRLCDPLAWMPRHLEGHLKEDCLIELWYKWKLRCDVTLQKCGSNEGAMHEWRARVTQVGAGKGCCVWECPGVRIGPISVQLIMAGLVQWGDFVDDQGEWLSWEAARDKHALGVQCKVAFEAVRDSVAGDPTAVQWRRCRAEAGGCWHAAPHAGPPEVEAVLGARRVPAAMGTWEYLVRRAGRDQKWEPDGEVGRGREVEVMKKAERARPYPRSLSTWLDAAGLRGELDCVLSRRAQGVEDEVAPQARRLWGVLEEWAATVCAPRTAWLGGKRGMERGASWGTGPDEPRWIRGPAGKALCATGWTCEVDEAPECDGAVWVLWDADRCLLVGANRWGGYDAREAGGADVCAHAVLRTCVRSRVAECEGVTLANGATLCLDKGVAEMEVAYGASENWVAYTRMVLRTVLAGEAEEGAFTHCFWTDASWKQADGSTAAGLWRGAVDGDEFAHLSWAERVRAGLDCCRLPGSWDNDDGELFALVWAASIAYEEAGSDAAVLLLTDSWSMMQAVETAWKRGRAAVSVGVARAVLIESLLWYQQHMRLRVMWVPAHKGAVGNMWADAAAEAGHQLQLDARWVTQLALRRVTARQVVWVERQSDALVLGKPFQAVRTRARGWVLADTQARTRGEGAPAGTWAALAREARGARYRVLEGWKMGKVVSGDGVNVGTAVALSLRWGDHPVVPQGRRWRSAVAQERGRGKPGPAAWTGRMGCPCGRDTRAARGAPPGRAAWHQRRVARYVERGRGGRRVDTWGPVERAAERWRNSFALLSTVDADVRHVHSGECPMVAGRAPKVKALVAAVERARELVGALGGEWVVDVGARVIDIGVSEADRWTLRVRGRVEMTWRGGMGVTVGVRTKATCVGAVQCLAAGQLMMLDGEDEGVLRRRMREKVRRVLLTEQGAAAVGDFDFTVVLRTPEKAEWWRQRMQCVPLVDREVPRGGRRSTGERVMSAASLALRRAWEVDAVTEEPDMWQWRWQRQVEGALDGVEALEAGGRMCDESWQALAGLARGELADPGKDVPARARADVVGVVAGVQHAVAEMRDGWEAGTRNVRECAEGVAKCSALMTLIVRMWKAAAREMSGAMPWRLCRAEHVGWSMRWVQAWGWVNGRKSLRGRVKSGWRPGCTGMQQDESSGRWDEVPMSGRTVTITGGRVVDAGDGVPAKRVGGVVRVADWRWEGDRMVRRRVEGRDYRLAQREVVQRSGVVVVPAGEEGQGKRKRNEPPGVRVTLAVQGGKVGVSLVVGRGGSRGSEGRGRWMWREGEWERSVCARALARDGTVPEQVAAEDRCTETGAGGAMDPASAPDEMPLVAGEESVADGGDDTQPTQLVGVAAPEVRGGEEEEGAAPLRTRRSEERTEGGAGVTTPRPSHTPTPHLSPPPPLSSSP